MSAHAATRFRDRAEAGGLLAARLARYRDEHPVVLGIARGGVPVAAEVAAALGAPLEAIVVRKLGAPGSPEYALGAIAEGGAAVLSPDALLEAGVRDEEVERIAEREAAALARAVRRLRGDRPFPDLAGRTAIVVDDGIATGATARAAARCARRAGAVRVVLAAPVVAPEVAPDLRADADEVVAVEWPDPFLAVGVWYERFGPVTDGEVDAALARGGAEPREVGAGATDVTADTPAPERPGYPRR